MTLHVVTAELLAGPQRRLEVNPRPSLEGCKRRPLQRLGDRIEGPELVRLAATVRQTPSIATDSPTVALRAVSGAASSMRTPPSPPETETTVPTSRISPVNIDEP